MKTDWNADYLYYKSILKDQRFPLGFVDLGRFDRNIEYVAKTQEKTSKTVRVASKSIRCLSLLKRVFKKGGTAYKGVLAFTMEEAGFLFENGLDDIVVAYPSVQKNDLDIFIRKTKQGANISLMADSFEHLEVISHAATESGSDLKICLEIDMSYRPWGKVHLGVRRSPAHSKEQILTLAKKAISLPGIQLAGIMGYEAQIASVNDNIPSQSIKNKIMRWIKNTSVKELTARRTEAVNIVKKECGPLEYVNGGGSGSLVSTGKDTSVTEVTAGSAFFAPGLFRYFHQVSFLPSAFFGLQVVRIPKKGIITCLGGGYIGSGEVGKNKLPWPVMPPGLSYFPMEGAGEVQTPLKVPEGKHIPELTDPVFFQHAKAGELCERFNELILIQDGEIVDKVPTYRGEGKAFL